MASLRARAWGGGVLVSARTEFGNADGSNPGESIATQCAQREASRGSEAGPKPLGECCRGYFEKCRIQQRLRRGIESSSEFLEPRIWRRDSRSESHVPIFRFRTTPSRFANLLLFTPLIFTHLIRDFPLCRPQCGLHIDQLALRKSSDHLRCRISPVLTPSSRLTAGLL